VIAGATALVVAAAGVVAWQLRYRTDHRVTPIALDDAVARYGEEQATAASLVAGNGVLPEPGVYSYATTGSDGVDALGGASHEYPATTTITVGVAGCGVAQRWDAAVERWDSFTTCADAGGVRLVAFTQFHQFFGTDDREDYECSGEPRPVGATPGTTWEVTCQRDGETAVWHGEVLDPEPVDVAGAPVDTDHVAWTIDNGDPADSQRTETWYLAGTDLVVRRTIAVVTAESSPVGTVHYTEQAELHLTSLTPAR